MRAGVKFGALLIPTSAICVVVYCWPVMAAHVRAPERTMQLFYMGDHESELADPLILAGDRVVPTVIQAIADPKMPLRRYAITFLGESRVREAIPALQRIVATETELGYFRGDALEAIFKIDPMIGGEMASDLVGEYSLADAAPEPDTDYLGWSAREVSSASPRLKQRRTVWTILKERWLPESFE